MVSLDGFAAREGPPNDWSALDWHRMDATLADDVADLLADADAYIVGRTTYEGFAEFWPTTGGAGAPYEERRIAPLMNENRKIVLSRSLREAHGGPATIARSVEDVAALEGDLVFLAGPAAGNALLAADLVDELWLHVHPIVLGRGLRLIARETPALELVEAKPRPTGVVSLRYARMGSRVFA